MTAEKLNAVKKYLDKHLRKDIIHFSSFSAAASVLLARKSDGGLRLCVDYQALNAITIKNCYSISLIRKTLNQLCQIKIYIKLDVIAAFNQICIKEGQK